MFEYPLEISLHGQLSSSCPKGPRGVPNQAVSGSVSLVQFKSAHMSDTAASSLYSSSSKASVPLLGNLAGSHLAQTLAQAVRLRWPVLLVGPSGSGKRRAIRALASATGRQLVEFSATSSTDSTELLGSFEQSSSVRAFYSAIELVADVLADLLLVALHGLHGTHSPGGGDERDASSITAFRLLVGESSSLLSEARAQSVEVVAGNLLGLPGGAALDDTLQKLMNRLGKACALHEVVATSYGDMKWGCIGVCERTRGQKVGTLLTSAQTLFSTCFRRAGFEARMDKEEVIRSVKGSKRKHMSKKGHVEEDTPAPVNAAVASGGDSGGFEWVDGVVVKAVERGQWLLLDNVNLCSASVLDRLNSSWSPMALFC